MFVSERECVGCCCSNGGVAEGGGEAGGGAAERREREVVCRSSTEAHDGITTCRNVSRVCYC